jgi:hypothetical protein
VKELTVFLTHVKINGLKLTESRNRKFQIKGIGHNKLAPLIKMSESFAYIRLSRNSYILTLTGQNCLKKLLSKENLVTEKNEFESRASNKREKVGKK